MAWMQKGMQMMMSKGMGKMGHLPSMSWLRENAGELVFGHKDGTRILENW